MAATFGRGAMTNGWVDIKNADVVFVMGGNPAENHPCGFKWALEAKKTRGAKIVCVDPRFQRTAAVSDIYAPLRAGTDIAFLSGIIRYALETKRYHADYVKLHTNAPYIVGEKYGFQDGLFSGFDEKKGEYDKTAWGYEPDAQTKAYGVDATLENPRCVFQLLKKHVDRYTPEMVERICGTPKAQFLKVAEMVTSTGNAERVGTIMYALGWTQHTTGVQIIRAAAMLQLLLGNVGRPGGGVNALRGHSNIQGATDMARDVRHPARLPQGARARADRPRDVPGEVHALDAEQEGLGVDELLDQLPQVHGLAAQGDSGARRRTKENDFGYAWLPKVDGNYSWSYMFDDMYRGAACAWRRRARAGGLHLLRHEPGRDRSQLGEDGRRARQAEVAGDGGEPGERDRGVLEGATKELRRPGRRRRSTPRSTCFPRRSFAEKDGSFTNSARWVQWKWKAWTARASPKSDQEIIARILLALRTSTARSGGALPERCSTLLAVHQPGQSRTSARC